jgi:hypothetical protein
MTPCARVLLVERWVVAMPASMNLRADAVCSKTHRAPNLTEIIIVDIKGHILCGSLRAQLRMTLHSWPWIAEHIYHVPNDLPLTSSFEAAHLCIFLRSLSWTLHISTWRSQETHCVASLRMQKLLCAPPSAQIRRSHLSLAMSLPVSNLTCRAQASEADGW